jgi:hypothetical protein
VALAREPPAGAAGAERYDHAERHVGSSALSERPRHAGGDAVGGGDPRGFCEEGGVREQLHPAVGFAKQSTSLSAIFVRILTAGPKTDTNFVRMAGRATYVARLDAGVRIYEWQPTTRKPRR